MVDVLDELADALDQARSFIECFSDVVDGSDGIPEPNRAMSLVSVIDYALAAYDKAKAQQSNN